MFRSLAIEACSSKSVRSARGEICWAFALERCQAVVSMEEWSPETLVELDLSNCGLTHLFLGELTQLKTLNCADNFISSIEKCGLERLAVLESLDLSHNKLRKNMFNYKSLDPLS